MVESTHQGSSPQLGTNARIFLNLFQDLTGYSFSGRQCTRRYRGASGGFVNLEDLPAQSLGGAHRVACVYL